MTTVLVDMDGVLCDFEGHRAARLRERGYPTVPLDQVTDFYGRETYRRLLGENVAAAAHAVTLARGFFKTIPPLPGALDGLRALARRPGLDVRICSKPMSANPYCMGEKLHWIHRHLGFAWVHENAVVSVKSSVDGDFLIDDRPDIVTVIAQKGEPAPRWRHVLFRQPWNAASTAHHAVMHDWTDIAWLEGA